MSFGYELISETDRLQGFPEFGRTVPEYRDDNIREIIFRHIASFIESITSEGSVKLHASGIQREDFQNCRLVRPQVGWQKEASAGAGRHQ